MFSHDSGLSSVSKSRDNQAPELVGLDSSLRRFYRYQTPVTTYYDEYPSPTGLSYSHEKIVYDRGDEFFKNVIHTKTVRSMRSGPKYWVNGTFPGTTSPNYSIVMMPDWYYALSAGTVPGHPDNPGLNAVAIQLEDLAGALSRAHRNMLPRMEDIAGGTNFINFVLELRDVKMMFSLWKKSMGVLRNVSAGILNYSYAWRPFISDLQNIHNALCNMDKYVSRWNEDAKAGVVYTRHADITADVWRTNQSSNSTTTDSSWSTFCNGHVAKNTIIRTYSEGVVVKAHMSFRPNRLDFSGLHKLAAYFDVAGLGDPLSIIWEAIPFSFLVDYFVSVSKFLSQFDYDFYTTPITLVDFGYSIKTIQKYTYQRNLQVKRSSNGALSDFTGGQSFFLCNGYTRKRIGLPALPQGGMPSDVDLGMLEFHWPNLRQAFLMVNLFNVLRH